jgi:hypothetical protein
MFCRLLHRFVILSSGLTQKYQRKTRSGWIILKSRMQRTKRGWRKDERSLLPSNNGGGRCGRMGTVGAGGWARAPVVRPDGAGEQGGAASAGARAWLANRAARQGGAGQKLGLDFVRCRI